MPGQKPEFVVNCLFQPFTLPYPESIKLSLKKSIDFLDSLDFPVVENASIRFFNEDSLIGSFKYSEGAQQYYLDGMYHLDPGTYKLEVSHENESFISYDTLPQKVNPDKVVINPLAGYDKADGRAFARVTIFYEDPAELNNYYEVSISHANDSANYRLSTDFPSVTTESYYPTVMNIEGKNPEYLPYSDKGFNGQQVSVSVEYLLPFAPVDGNIESHVIIIHFRSISANYFLYRSSQIRQSYASKTDIIYGQGEPVKVHGNIPGNYGIFAGFQSVDIAFIIENTEIIEYEF